jgi:hypothetical protein
MSWLRAAAAAVRRRRLYCRLYRQQRRLPMLQGLRYRLRLLLLRCWWPQPRPPLLRLAQLLLLQRPLVGCAAARVH